VAGLAQWTGSLARRKETARPQPKGGVVSIEMPAARTAPAPGAAAFANNRLEWRRLLAEFGGTFFLVLVAAGAGVVNAVSHGQVGRAAAVTAPGLMVLGLIYTIGETSGAHVNPAVTVAFAARGNFPWRRVPGYLLAQFAGATAAAWLLRGLFGTAGGLGGTVPGRGIGGSTALVIEAILTFGLVTVILGTASGARNVGHNAAIAVGGYVALAGLWASPVSGASMNPARSLGPALAGGGLGRSWIYIAGPLAGALLAVALAWALRGPPSSAADLAAQGTIEAAPPSLPAPSAPTVVVTDAQVEAAKMIVDRDRAAGRKTSEAIHKIAQATPRAAGTQGRPGPKSMQAGRIGHGAAHSQ
jgi:aquaporin Z